MTADLKPCPLCGGDAEIWRAHEGRTAWVACMGRCAVLVSKQYTTDAEAIAAWNTRATPALAAMTPEVAKLVEAAACAAVDWANGDYGMSAEKAAGLGVYRFVKRRILATLRAGGDA